MFLAQVPTIAGLEVTVDRRPRPRAGARRPAGSVGWDEARIAAHRASPTTAARPVTPSGVEVVIEATGNPAAGIAHALAAIAAGKHIVMVNVEADVLAGPLLAAKAARAPASSTRMAYGDQPALICELVDWARAARLRGRRRRQGHQVPARATTPSRRTTVWDHYGLTPEQAQRGGHEPADVQLLPRRHQVGDRDGGGRQRHPASTCRADGLRFPPCGVDDLPHVLRPRAAGGAARAATGMVEVVSSLERDGRPVFRDLRWGVYVVLKAPNDYAARLLQAVRAARPTRAAATPRCTSPTT